MITITLPGGAAQQFDQPIDGHALAAASPKRAKNAIAVELDGKLKDLAAPITRDANARLITPDMPEGLEILRHDAAHVMAQAVQELFPGTQVTIGPVIENGFYYDFARSDPFRPEDLPKIERRMSEIVARDLPIAREVWERAAAVKHFRKIGETYKAELIEAIPEGEEITIYRQGDWLDLCRGPHLPSTGRLGTAFKLTRIAGAYWRGDSRNPMLQRIYGTCWASPKELRAYLTRLEEAEKRDHRKLGRAMSLFHFEDSAPGAAFWHPEGWRLLRALSGYLRRVQNAAGYREVNTPDMLDRSLWERSGHWDKFADNMFTAQTPDQRIFALKPMNCPGHIAIYRQGLRSYRDLPLRLSEFGKVHRCESSGSLHGLLRARHFTQDDAHIFCTHDQIAGECRAVAELILSIYRNFGFEDVRIEFSDRPEQRIGSDDIWDRAEDALRKAAQHAGVQFRRNPGDGAFYGPKLDFILRDAIGRDWQCGTVQLDFNLPGRLGAFYIGADGAKHTPVMIHRALFGSIERFAAILIEHYAGWLPLWLAPVQAVVSPITNAHDAYARKAAACLEQAGLAVRADLRSEKIAYKVREHSLARIPLLAAVGAREAADNTIALRRLGEAKARQQILPLEDAARRLAQEAQPPVPRRAAQSIAKP